MTARATERRGQPETDRQKKQPEHDRQKRTCRYDCRNMTSGTSQIISYGTVGKIHFAKMSNPRSNAVMSFC
jgi:hypothetical protein